MLLLCSSMVQAIENNNKTSQTNQGSIRIALPTEDNLNKTGSDSFQRLANFLKEYWQIWSIDKQQNVVFVHMPTNQTAQALKDNQIDIAAIAIYDNNKQDILYSIPYAQFKQRLYRRIAQDESDGLQLGIHSTKNDTLNYLDHQIQRSYYQDIDQLLTDYKKFDALYSTTPWLLTQKLTQLHLLTEFYLSTDETPRVNLHFATRKNDRHLLYKINDDLRSVSQLQANLWKTKYAASGDNIELALGQYFVELTEAEKQYIIDHTELHFPVTKNGFPPYIISNSFTNISEQGLAIDLIKIAQQKTGIIFKPHYVTSFDDAKVAIDQQHADLFLHAEYNSNKEQSYQFTTPYLKAQFSLVSRFGYMASGIVTDLDHETISVVADFNTTALTQTRYPKAKLKIYPTIEKAITAVSTGEANIFIGRSLISGYIINQKRLANLVIRALPSFIDSSEYAFATTDQHTALVTLLNRTINSIPNNQFNDIFNKWNKTAQPENSIQQQIDVAYRQVGYLLAAILLVALTIFWIYYRQDQVRKLAQIKIKHALAIAEDARAQAEKSAQAKITFLARMSHEIRTPMNGVLGMAEALSYTELNNNQQELLGTLKGSARNLLALLNDILDFSKIDAGKLVLESVPVNFHLLFRNIVNSFSHIKNVKNIKITYYVDNLITHNYLTDPTRITQVLNNLISNAIKFTEQGTIDVSVLLNTSIEKNGDVYDTLSISVRDTGIGIPVAQQSSLFTPFIQADDQITRKYGGTGLGLSISQEIVMAMAGVIKLESTPNVGSTFHFTLTFKRAGIESDTEDRRINERETNAKDDQRFKNLRTLIAEDNLVNIKVLSAQLARINIHADIAHDGEQALLMHTKNPYDIIISDCHMPIIDGFELAKRIKQQGSDTPIWLIAITADALSGASENCILAGFDDYMAKPCPQEEITNKLNNAYRQLLKQQHPKLI